MRYIITIIYAVVLLQVSGQNVDSSLTIYNDESMGDTARLNAIHSLAWDYLFVVPDSAFYYAQKEKELAEKLRNDKYLAFSYNTMGGVYYVTGDYPKAIGYYEQSLDIRKKMGDKQGEADTYNNVGAIYHYMSNFEKAKEYYEASIKLYEELGNDEDVAYALGNLGTMFHDMGNYSKAIDLYYQTLKLYEEFNDKAGVASMYNNIGIVYNDQKDFDNALKYYEKCLLINEEINDVISQIAVLNNMGIIHQKQGKRDLSIDFYNEALEKSSEIGEKQSMADAHSNLGGVYLEMNEPALANKHYELSLEINKEIDDQRNIAASGIGLGMVAVHNHNFQKAINWCLPAYEKVNQLEILDVKRNACDCLHRAYTGVGQHEKAYNFLMEYYSLNDSLINEEKTRDLAQRQYQYLYERKTIEDSIRRVNEEKIKEAELLAEKERDKRKRQELAHEADAQRLRGYFLGGLLLLALVFGVFIYNRFKTTQKQKGIIEEQKLVVEEKNREIRDSIHYASRIQEAIMPSMEAMNEALKDGFVLYLPKDVVAGDFYWMESYEGEIFFAAADCTGHGVPGAMVSVVCSNALTKALLEEGITDTGKLLDRTREIVISRLEKSGETVKDGMDISLCAINLETLKIRWSGANNPLWLVKKDKELKEIRADKQPIGKYAVEKPFTQHKLQLEKGDSLYLFTDGYQDQFGGEKNKKFKSANFKKLISEIQSLSMEKQCSTIQQVFEDWRGEMEQIDDICVIGVRV